VSVRDWLIQERRWRAGQNQDDSARLRYPRRSENANILRWETRGKFEAVQVRKKKSLSEIFLKTLHYSKSKGHLDVQTRREHLCLMSVVTGYGLIFADLLQIASS